MAYLDQCKEFHKLHLAAKYGAPIGCTEAQIATVAALYSTPLPKAYVEYLQWMGNDKYGPFVGSEWFFDNVKENSEYVPELLESNNCQFAPLETLLSFFGHQGYMTAWFDMPASCDDPPCHYYFEGSTDEPQLIEHFSHFVMRDLGVPASAMGN